MGLSRFRKPLLKSQASPSLFLFPPLAQCSWWQFRSQHNTGIFFHSRIPQYFRSTYHNTALNRAPSTATAEAPTQDEPESEQSADSYSRSSPNRRISSFQSSTIDDLLRSAIEKDAESDSKTKPFSIRDTLPRAPGSIASRMQMPVPKSASSSPQISEFDGAQKYIPLRAKRTVRSTPALGRSVDLRKGGGFEFGQALQRLNAAVATNRIKQDKARQKYHERPGLKRKRLKSERWRRKFLEGFRATVLRVKRMRRKGW